MAEREMKSFIIHQVNDWDKLRQLLKHLAEDNAFVKDAARRDQYKFFALIAEVFQHQIVEYLPLVLGVLFKKLTKERSSLSYARHTRSAGRHRRGCPTHVLSHIQ